MRPVRVIPTAVESLPVRSDNGFDMCEDCAFCESEVCEHCEEGERFLDADDLEAVAA